MSKNFILERAKQLINIDLTLTSTPSHIILSQFYKSNKNLGSKDRELLSDIFYNYLRNYHLIKRLSSVLELPEFVISCLILVPNRQDLIRLPNSILGEINSRLKPQLTKISSFISTNYLINKELPLSVRFNNENDEELINNNNFFSPDTEVSILSDTFSLPNWFINEIWDLLQKTENKEEFLSSFSQKAPLTIRLNSNFDLAKKDVVIKNLDLHSNSWELNERSFDCNSNTKVTNSHWYQNGLVEIQDKSSQMVALLIQQLEPNTVLDACAGAGGKSLHIQDLLPNSKIHAYDEDQKRLTRTLPRLERQKTKNIDLINNKNFLSSSYDLVLLDAPCTGSGTIRRQPEIKLRLDKDDIINYQIKQKAIVDEYVNFLTDGSYLIYSTCSLFSKENTEINNYIFDKYKFERIDILELIPELKNYNLPQFNNNEIYITPNTFNSDGFYICVFKCSN